MPESINLEVIPGKGKYTLGINAEDEELIRKAARQLREKYLAYQQTYSDAVVTDLDILAMVAIDIAVSHLRLEDKNDTVPFSDKIQQLDNELKGYLKEQ
ncbi:MAG: cell division protein ZapA [Tannerella sp.]|jgi:cell division protein ZapA|nr:cell division protein ZapA [Tannerella sp.]